MPPGGIPARMDGSQNTKRVPPKTRGHQGARGIEIKTDVDRIRPRPGYAPDPVRPRGFVLRGAGSPFSPSARIPTSRGKCSAAYISVRIYFMSRPHIQQTALSTAKTQAPDIGPPKIRPLSAISRLPIANRTAVDSTGWRASRLRPFPQGGELFLISSWAFPSARSRPAGGDP